MIYSGQDAKLQIGLESEWGTEVTPTEQIPILSESVKFNVSYEKDASLLGSRMASGLELMQVDVSGDIQCLIRPDRIGLLLAATLGDETVAAAVPSTNAAYKHIFQPIAGGTGSTLPSFTIVIDRKVDIFGYTGCKISQMSLSASAKGFVEATFSFVGKTELAGDSLGALTNSTLKPLKFRQTAVDVGDTSYGEVISFSLDYINNLEDPTQTLGSGLNIVEIEPQERSMVINFDTRYTTVTNTTRENYYKTDSVVAVDFTFTSGDTIAGDSDVYYAMNIIAPYYSIQTADVNVSGPGRIMMSLSGEVTQVGDTSVIFELIDGDSTEYLT